MKDAVILLAGGRSTRMGQPKGLFEFQGVTWLSQQLQMLAAAGIQNVCLVLGFHYHEYLAALPYLKHSVTSPQEIFGLRLLTIYNTQHHLGPFSSLRAGWQTIASQAQAGFFVMPIDVPCPSKVIWAALSSDNYEDVQVAVPVCQGKGGHPIWVKKQFGMHLQSIELDASSARLDVQIQLLPRKQVRRVIVEDERVNLNLNRPEDWQGLKHLLKE